MKTFLPWVEAGRVKVLRYQVRPLQRFISPTWLGVDQSSKVSMSLKVWGRETEVQEESSKSGAWALGGSALMNFQSVSKLSLESAAARAERRRSAARQRARGRKRVYMAYFSVKKIMIPRKGSALRCVSIRVSDAGS